MATACLAAGVVAGCGSAAQQPTGLSSQSAGTLRSQLAAVASDAARGDRAGALTALSAASAEVGRDASKLTPGERAALSTGIARLRSRIAATVKAPPATPATPTTATTQSTSTPAPPPAPPGAGPKGQGPPDHGHGHHHHGDQGNGGDGGGD